MKPNKQVEIKNKELKISYTVRLEEEITDLAVADTLVFLQQGDSKMQELFPKYLQGKEQGEDLSEEHLLQLANEYRQYLFKK